MQTPPTHSYQRRLSASTVVTDFQSRTPYDVSSSQDYDDVVSSRGSVTSTESKEWLRPSLITRFYDAPMRKDPVKRTTRFNLQRRVAEALGVCVKGMSLGRPVQQWVGTKYAPWASRKLGVALEAAVDPDVTSPGPFFLMGSNPPDGASIIPTSGLHDSTDTRADDASDPQSSHESDSEPEPDVLSPPLACSLGNAANHQTSRMGGHVSVAIAGDELPPEDFESDHGFKKDKSAKFSEPERLFPIVNASDNDIPVVPRPPPPPYQTRKSPDDDTELCGLQQALDDVRVGPAERGRYAKGCEVNALQQEADAQKAKRSISASDRMPPEEKVLYDAALSQSTRSIPTPPPETATHFLFCVAPKAKNAEFVRSCVPTKSHITDIVFITSNQAIVAMGDGEVELYSIEPGTGAIQYLAEATWFNEPIIQLSAHTLDPTLVATASADRSITVRQVALGLDSEVALNPYLSTQFPEDTTVTALSWSHFQPNLLNCCIARDSDDVNPLASSSTLYRYDTRVGLEPKQHVFEFQVQDIRMLCVEQFTEMQSLVGGEGGEILQVDFRRSGPQALVNATQDPFCEAVGSIEYCPSAGAFMTCGMTDYTVWKQDLTSPLSGAAQPAFHSLINGNRAQRVNESNFNIAAAFVDDKTLFTTTSTGLVSTISFDLSKALVQSPEEMLESKSRRRR